MTVRGSDAETATRRRTCLRSGAGAVSALRLKINKLVWLGFNSPGDTGAELSTHRKVGRTSVRVANGYRTLVPVTTIR